MTGMHSLRRTRSIVAMVLCGSLFATAAHADKLLLPTTEEATQAFLEMMGSPELTDAKLELGTCIAAVQAEHAQQVACTVVLKLGAGSSETQADFYREGMHWVAQPSTSQDQLPFPDPKLQ